ncbi:hypothetical protein FUAX_45570 (plasmid) [Fulvitalea axinellae]|uniref:Bacterial bifunctional deaminase-reductase C-terminal domain-containing protein n=1 Tax=Fulvitalea axinellae TaxID=1182444 RepID=A0AAU9CRW9_9BACT|nr:hypothetical protein FUAX_45570 [Fulvitalea axinellae]
MKDIVYYVAVSLDGFIAGDNGDISQFIMQGEGVDKYREDLNDFRTVIMGRKTYEFGYQYGLPPGQPAYPHMEHYIFSDSMSLDNTHESVHIEKMDINKVKSFKENSPTDIYLCGGGEFAGWLLDHGLVDRLKLKVNPVILGSGTPLFGSSKTKANWKLITNELFSDGLQIATYEFQK